jgi:hypothetical protein
VSYAIETLMKEFPAAVAARPNSAESPKLPDFLEHGYLTDLCRAVLDDQIPEPYKTLALIAIPPSAMIATMIVRADEIEQGHQNALKVDPRG